MPFPTVLCIVLTVLVMVLRTRYALSWWLVGSALLGILVATTALDRYMHRNR